MSTLIYFLLNPLFGYQESWKFWIKCFERLNSTEANGGYVLSGAFFFQRKILFFSFSFLSRKLNENEWSNWFDLIFVFKPEFLCFGYDRFEEGSVWWSILSLVALFHWLSRHHSLRWITVVTSVRFWLRVLFGCWKNVEGSNLSSEHYPLLGCWEK